ncbi:hypothetical protein [Haloferula sp.]|uniref:hypothetical protein n=1 Tax=Haloferula sp. TaxID=2497595 RepID=UPI00329D46AD
MRPLFILTLLSLGSCTALESAPEENPVRLRDHQLTEASGIAVSHRNPNHLWLINDSGSAATAHLADTKGMARGFLHLKGVKNTDWEDLATFKLDGKPYLLVADTGDNEARRAEVKLHFIAEPRPISPDSSLGLGLKPDWTLRFRYEDGPRDCEAVAVNPTSNSILLITKRGKQPAVYQLPLLKDSNKTLTAKRIAPLAKLNLPPKTRRHPFASQPTGLDISADGKCAAVVTYRGVYLFRRSAKESWAQAFTKAPEILGAHGLSQAEALAFSPDGRLIYVTSEGKRPRLVTMPVEAR